MRILLIDDDDDLREVLCDILLLAGQGSHQCTPLASYHELLVHQAQALRTELAIIDINLGADVPNGLDCERWLRINGYAGRVIFLTGHALTHPLVVQAVRSGRVEILEKPQGIDRLIEIVSSGKAA